MVCRGLGGAPGVRAAALARLYRLEIDATVRATAAAQPDTELPSLDVLHVATAQVAMAETDELEAFVAHDQRLLSAAAGVGLPVASLHEEPGSDAA